MNAKVSVAVQVHRVETKSEIFTVTELHALSCLMNGVTFQLTKYENDELTAKIDRLHAYARNGG